jgi:hypothetical protein
MTQKYEVFGSLEYIEFMNNLACLQARLSSFWPWLEMSYCRVYMRPEFANNYGDFGATVS